MLKYSFDFRLIRYAIMQILAGIVIIFMLIPLYAMIVSSLKKESASLVNPILLPPTSSTFSTEAYSRVFLGGGAMLVYYALKDPLWHSVVFTLSATLLSTILGALAAYAVYSYMRTRPFISNLGFTLVAIGTFVPLQALVIPLMMTLAKLHIYLTVWGLIFTYLLVYVPTATLLMLIFLPAVPNELIEAAKVDGASEWRTFWRVVLPIAFPGFLSTLIYNFIMIWNNFFIPLLTIANKPQYLVLPLAAMDYESYGIAYSDAFATGVISSIIPLIIFIILGRYFIRGLAALGGGSKGP